MIFHSYYAEVPPDEVARFVASQELGRLITVGEDGMPHVGLYPFVWDGGAVDLHLVREDELAVDLAARPSCLFEVGRRCAPRPRPKRRLSRAGRSSTRGRPTCAPSGAVRRSPIPFCTA